MQCLNGVQLGQQTINEIFYGELAATSKGEMLSALTSVQGFAGYVAIEQVIGCLSGKQGSFVLQHFATLQNTTNHLLVTGVPNSGSGEFVGMKRKMAIRLEQGQHYYEFAYELVS